MITTHIFRYAGRRHGRLRFIFFTVGIHLLYCSKHLIGAPIRRAIIIGAHELTVNEHEGCEPGEIGIE